MLDTTNRAINAKLKIEGDSLEDCIKKLREQYEGRTEYLIHGHRTIPIGGIRGFFTHKTKTEVTYMLVDLTKSRQPRRITDTAANFEQQKQLIINSVGKQPNPQLLEIAKKLDKIDIIEEKLSQLIANKAFPEIHPAIQKAEEILALNEFTSSIIKQFVQRLRHELTLEELSDENKIQQKIIDYISELLIIEKLPETPKKPRVIVLVGPTGEGKTTTIAKLAAEYRLANPESNIYMVTIDQFRVAAGKQLETYAEILQMDYTDVNSADEIRNVIEKIKNLDVLLIDSAGFSPNDFQNIGKMRKILDITELHPEIYLVVSASKTTSALLSVFTSYELFQCRAVIVTKMDEADRIGNVISALIERKKSVAYITTGQKVSSDIKEAEILDFLQKLIGIKI
jgi:flagellar biosynthesis protein FlhF